MNGEKNEKGKEYDYYGKLIFDGEYLNGKKWNGKGKEYKYNGQIKFEYKYFNGKRINDKIYDFFDNIYNFKDVNGFVKEYYDGNILVNQKEYKDFKSKLKFECKYLFGNKNWKRK